MGIQKPIKFKRIEIRAPRWDPHPEKSTTENWDWRMGLFIIFEDYEGKEFDWMPTWDELDKIMHGRDDVEKKNKELCKKKSLSEFM